MVFSDDSPPRFAFYPTPSCRLSPGLSSSCTYLPPFSAQPGSQPLVVVQATRKWSCKCTMHAVPCPRHPHPLSFSSSYFVSLHGVWWAWDGLFVCFFLSLHLYRDIHPHHPGATITSYLLSHLSTLTSRCSSDRPWCNGGTLSSIPSAWCYGLHGAMWASLRYPASGRKGFASTDSQSYIFLIAVFLFLVFFSYPPRILGRS